MLVRFVIASYFIGVDFHLLQKRTSLWLQT